MTKIESQIANQLSRINHLDGEVRALKIAKSFVDSAIKSKTVNLRQMKDALSRMKATAKGKERYASYKEKVEGLKRKISKSNEQKLQEELNDMELKGKL